MTSEQRPAVRRFAIVAVFVPLVATISSIIGQAGVASELPDPIAVHWNGAGEPDGFAPAWVAMAVTAATGAGIPLLLAGFALAGLRRGGRGTTYRFLGAVTEPAPLTRCTAPGLLGA